MTPLTAWQLQRGLVVAAIALAAVAPLVVDMYWLPVLSIAGILRARSGSVPGRDRTSRR